jgi:hypothetical protein
MPAHRTQDDEKEYVPKHTSTTSVINANRTVRTRPRGSPSISAMQDIFPFPIGLPTEPIHYALLAFSAISLPYLDLGTVDNMACWLYFSNKRYKDNIWSLRLVDFPARYDFTTIMRRKQRLPLQRVADNLATIPYDQWKSNVEPVITKTIELSQNLDENFRNILASEGFLQQVDQTATLIRAES